MEKREKEYMLDELVEKVEGVPSLFVTGFRGLSTLDMNELRRELDKMSVRYMVVKNRIAKLALERTNLSGVVDFLEGPVGFTFGEEGPEVISKALVNFAKGHEALKICGAVADGEVMSADYIKELAMLPSRQELLAIVVSRLASPMTGLVATLNQLVVGFVRVLEEIKNKKDQQNKEG